MVYGIYEPKCDYGTYENFSLNFINCNLIMLHNQTFHWIKILLHIFFYKSSKQIKLVVTPLW